jgi:hypothetical protein
MKISFMIFAGMLLPALGMIWAFGLMGSHVRLDGVLDKPFYLLGGGWFLGLAALAGLTPTAAFAGVKKIKGQLLLMPR